MKKTNIRQLTNFATGPLHYRRQQATVRREALARAAGLKKGFRPIIWDATAGLGQDSFILASLGCEIYLFERSAEVYALLKESLEQAASHPELAPVIARMHLFAGDSLLHLDHPPIIPEVIYLDPMFPEKSRSAACRKSMQILQILAGQDSDADALLQKALSCATQRVVVKRPRLSPCLADLKPDFILKGSSSRFDIYLRRNTHGNTARTPEPDPSP